MTLEKIYWLWLLSLSAVLFLVMGADKGRARRGLWRVPEARLMGLGLLGGALGGLLGMLAFRHKTRHPLFFIGYPLLSLLQLGLGLWLWGGGLPG